MGKSIAGAGFYSGIAGAWGTQAYRLGVLALALASGLVLVACGGSGTTSSSEPAAAAPSAAAPSAAPLETSAAEESADNTLPTAEQRAMIEAETEAATGDLVWDGPITPAPAPADKHLVMLLCPVFLEGCNVAAIAGVEVAEALGWKLTQIEVEDPSTLSASFQQALNIGADAILIEGFSDALYPVELVKEAKAKGIPVVDQAGDLTPSPKGPDYSETINAIDLGRLMANVIMLQTDFQAKMISYETEEYESAVTYQREVVRWMEENCTDCELIATQQFVSSQMGTTLGSSTVADVRSNPEANVVLTPFDAFGTVQIPALQTAGLCDQVGVYSYSGNQVNLKWVAEGNCQAATISNNIPWSTWAAVDNIIRLLNGQPVEAQRVPMKLFTPENAPSDGVWNAEMDGVDYRGEYSKLWGIGG